MYIKLIKHFSILIFFILLSITNSYANELVFWGTWETIKELKQSIDILDKKNDILENDLKDLNADYKLKSYLKKDLNIYQFRLIRKIVWKYNEDTKIIENEMILDAKIWTWAIDNRRRLLEVKRVFYKWLIPYINKNYKSEYLDYIKKDAIIFNKQNIVKTDIVIKKDLLESKVSRIETKILEHKKYIDNSIKNIIETRLDEKISNLASNPSFIDLSDESKVKVLNKSIDKIKAKLENIEKSNWKYSSWILITTNISDDVLLKKIQTYDIAISKLETFKNKFIK
jgi:chaperonin cofactor prefoldin